MGVWNMPWTESKYSKNQINKAGKKICKGDASDTELRDAYKIVGNWRAAHAYPLYVITRKLRSLCGNRAMVVHRLKRMDSIVGKLKRFQQMSLFGMQDLGGCRVIAPTISDVYTIANRYENSRIRHTRYKENDYLQSPKPDGYRCLHRVYEYKSDDPTSKYNKMKIEIQFRTKLQHAWATAVEVMSLYTNSNLKSGVGEEQYFRFFALISSLFAIKEELPIVPNTSEDVGTLLKEIADLDKKYRFIQKLYHVSTAIYAQNLIESKENYDYFLMSLDINTNMLKIYGYSTFHLNDAIEQYNKLELLANTNNVLASAKSMEELREAYPNYFGDVGEFMAEVGKFFNDN